MEQHKNVPINMVNPTAEQSPMRKSGRVMIRATVKFNRATVKFN